MKMLRSCAEPFLCNFLAGLVEAVNLIYSMLIHTQKGFDTFAVGRYPPIFSPLGMCSLDVGEDHTTQRMGPDASWPCKVLSLFC